MVCGDDILFKMDEVFKMPANQFLFVVGYLKQKRKIEHQEQEQLLNKNKKKLN